MNREQKSALARQRILEAAIAEFSGKGYEGASLTAACNQCGISKGLVYHHFRDKNELYLLCVKSCFDSLTACLKEALAAFRGTPEERMQAFFEAWLRFFYNSPQYLGIFSSASFRIPPALAAQIAQARQAYDEVYTAVMMELLGGRPLRGSLPAVDMVGECRIYMDFFNTRFLMQAPDDQAVARQEAWCRQQMDILLYGVLDDKQ